MNKNLIKLIKNIDTSNGKYVNLLLKNGIVSIDSIIEGLIYLKNPKYIEKALKYLPIKIGKLIPIIKDIRSARLLSDIIVKYQEEMTTEELYTLVDILIEQNNLEYIYKTSLRLKNKVCNKKLLEAIIASKDPKYMYFCVRDNKEIDPTIFVEPLLAIKNYEYIINFAINAHGLDQKTIDKIANVIIKSNIPRYIFIFARDVENAPIWELTNAIIATNNAEYIWYFAINKKINKYFDELVDVLVKTKNVEYIYRLISHVTGKNLDKLIDTLVEIKNPRYIEKAILDIIDTIDISQISSKYKSLEDLKQAYLSKLKNGEVSSKRDFINLVSDVVDFDEVSTVSGYISKLWKVYIEISNNDDIKATYEYLINENTNLKRMLSINGKGNITNKIDNFKISYLATMEYDKGIKRNKDKYQAYFRINKNSRNNNIIKLIQNIYYDRGIVVNSLIRNNIIEEDELLKYAIEMNNPRYLLNIFKYVKYVSLDEIGYALIKINNPEYIYKFLKYNDGTDEAIVHAELIKSIIKINDPEYIYLTALLNSSIKFLPLLLDALIKNNQINYVMMLVKETKNLDIVNNQVIDYIVRTNNPQYMLLLLENDRVFKNDYYNKYLQSHYLELLFNGIKDTKDIEAMYLFAKATNYKVNEIAEEIILSNNPYYIYLFARDVKTNDISKLEDAIIMTGNPKYIYLFTRDVENADIEKLALALNNTKNEKYITLFVNNIEFSNKGILLNTLINITDKNIFESDRPKNREEKELFLIKLKYFIIMENEKQLNKNKEVYQKVFKFSNKGK